MLNQQRHYEQQGENHAPYPQSYWRPLDLQLLFGRKLEKEHAGGRPRLRRTVRNPAPRISENAILSALKADQSDGGKNKGQARPVYDLQIAL